MFDDSLGIKIQISESNLRGSSHTIDGKSLLHTSLFANQNGRECLEQSFKFKLYRLAIILIHSE